VLAEHFGRRMALELGWPDWPGFSDAMSASLLAYGWPGNVRELRNVVERAVYRWDNPDRPIDAIQFDPFESPYQPAPIVKPAQAPVPARDVAPAAAVDTETEAEAVVAAASHRPEDCADFRLAVAEYEKAILAAALERCRWNQRAAAAALQLSYDQLRHAMKRHQLAG
jgi:psp operon transcriptional activator